MLVSDMNKSEAGRGGEAWECVILNRVIREGLNSLCYGHTDLKVNGRRFGNRY